MKKKIIFFFILNVIAFKANAEVAFIDLNYILSESIKGKKILNELSVQNQENNKIFEASEKKFEIKKNEITKLKNIISEDELKKKNWSISVRSKKIQRGKKEYSQIFWKFKKKRIR